MALAAQAGEARPAKRTKSPARASASGAVKSWPQQLWQLFVDELKGRAKEQQTAGRFARAGEAGRWLDTTRGDGTAARSHWG